MSEIKNFGLKPKHDCQVGCPVLKDLYDTFKHEADSLWKEVDNDNGRSSDIALASMSARAAAYSTICSSLGLILNPKAAAMLLESMMAGVEEEE